MRFTKAQYISEHRCDTRLSIVVSVANGMHSIFNFIHTVMWSCFCVSRLSCLWVRESRFACLRQSTDRNISTSLADDDIYITITFTMLESKEKKTEPHTQQTVDFGMDQWRWRHPNQTSRNTNQLNMHDIFGTSIQWFASFFYSRFFLSFSAKSILKSRNLLVKFKMLPKKN